MVRTKSRSRSRSREKDRKRDRGDRDRRDKDRDRDRERDKSEKDRHRSGAKSSGKRSRSRSPRNRKEKRTSPTSSSRRERRDSSSSSSESSRSSITGHLTLGNVKPKSSQMITASGDKAPIILDPKELEGKSAEEIEMMKLMGFSGFDTTKGKHVDGSCNAYAINIQQKRKYRQYMNRKGGFNRPLDFVA